MTTRVLRRTIEPIDVEIDVDLYEVVETFHGPVKDGSLDKVITWIEAGDVELEVMSPKHFLSEGWPDRARKLQNHVGGTGKDPHRLLCATLWLYESISISPRTRRRSVPPRRPSA